MGQGIGYIDVHLLASTALSSDTRLWTKDRRLAAVAIEVDLAFDEGAWRLQEAPVEREMALGDRSLDAGGAGGSASALL